MNKTVAGGVVAWVDGESDSEIANVALREGSYGCYVPLVFASDLEACQQRLDSVQALHRNAVDNATAAQAEADRLRMKIAKALHSIDRCEAGFDGLDDIRLHLTDDDDIHAAKTEQERGE